jgi:hypothetical protein
MNALHRFWAFIDTERFARWNLLIAKLGTALNALAVVLKIGAGKPLNSVLHSGLILLASIVGWLYWRRVMAREFSPRRAA